MKIDSGKIMDKDFLEKADRFVSVANELGNTSEPSDVLDVFSYGCARYAAFVISQVAKQTGDSPQMLQNAYLAGLSDTIQHHLAQFAGPAGMPSPATAPPATDLLNDIAKTPAQIKASKAMERIMRAYQTLDITVIAFLRGSGEQEAAELLAAGMQDEFDPFSKFCRAIYQVWEAGLLPAPIAVCALMNVCTEVILRNSPEGYVKDPEKDEQARKKFENLFADLGLHKLATMMRKSPGDVERLANEGMIALFGDSVIDLKNAFASMQGK